MKNGYPSNFIDSCVKHYLQKSRMETTPQFGPPKRQVTLCLPYTGVKGDKLKRQLRRLVGAVLPSINVRVVFKPMLKLSSLSKLKSAYPLKSRSGVVYRVNCLECDEFYIGMTTRRLHQRLKEHWSVIAVP